MTGELSIEQQISEWAYRNRYPDIVRFERNGEICVRIWLEPWYGLKMQNPPLGIQQLVLTHLLEIFDSWQRELQREGKIFDLQFHLFEEAFIKSEIVATRMSRNGARARSVYHPATEVKRFPYELFLGNRKRLRDFEWQQFRDGEYLHPVLDNLNVLEIEDSLKKGFRKEWPNGRKDPGNYLLFRPVDRIWIGRGIQ